MTIKQYVFYTYANNCQFLNVPRFFKLFFFPRLATLAPNELEFSFYLRSCKQKLILIKFLSLINTNYFN